MPLVLFQECTSIRKETAVNIYKSLNMEISESFFDVRIASTIY